MVLILSFLIGVFSLFSPSLTSFFPCRPYLLSTPFFPPRTCLLPLFPFFPPIFHVFLLFSPPRTCIPPLFPFSFNFSCTSSFFPSTLLSPFFLLYFLPSLHAQPFFSPPRTCLPPGTGVRVRATLQAAEVPERTWNRAAGRPHPPDAHTGKSPSPPSSHLSPTHVCYCFFPHTCIYCLIPSKPDLSFTTPAYTTYKSFMTPESYLSLKTPAWIIYIHTYSFLQPYTVY